MSFDGIMWRRLRYMLSPQLDLYRNIRMFMEHELPMSPTHVLDIGCGNGVGTQLLYHDDAHVLGVDVDKRAIDFAKALFPHCEWMELDITAEKAREYGLVVSFDGPKMLWHAVTCIETIEHLPDREHAEDLVRWVSESVTPDVFICSTINKDAENIKQFRHHLNFIKYDDPLK